MIPRATTLFIAVCGLVGCSGPSTASLTVYSGRSEALVEPLIEMFQNDTGETVSVIYGGSAQLAATILEEGPATAADVYYGQDAGALGALAREGRLRQLPAALLDRVDARFRARDGRWIGTSGRARVLAYNTGAVAEDELPDSVASLIEPQWKGRVGWAPQNGSFQAFVTAMRVIDGDEATRRWLAGMVANEPKAYRDNTPLFEAVLSGEVDIGLINHYYLFRFLDAATEDVPVRNYSPRGGGPGALVNIAGAGIVDSTRHRDAAERFIDYLVSQTGQGYFAEVTFEYPVIEGVQTHPLIRPLSEIRTPDIDLSELDDLEATLAMLKEAGAL